MNFVEWIYASVAVIVLMIVCFFAGIIDVSAKIGAILLTLIALIVASLIVPFKGKMYWPKVGKVMDFGSHWASRSDYPIINHILNNAID